MGSTEVKRAWWKESSVYQIYPASFKDSNGDGLGDIPGITSKLDYIKALGSDIVWTCPIYKSPQVDMGYDISDYRDIHAPYGTLADVDKLIEGCHSRGMKFLMDLVVNHTSDRHNWFLEAKKGKDNPYRDFYIWKKPQVNKDGSKAPPNNWGSVWGGSAWEYDEASDEYYLHIFAPEQPDLNWENPKVRDEVHSIIRFWLDKGVDGFRMDVINFISKVPGFPDAPITRPDVEWQPGDKYFACGPRLHEYLQAIGKILKEYNAFSVGEMPCVDDPKEILKAVGFGRGELNMIFHFEIVDMDIGDRGKFSPRQWKMSTLKDIVNKWQTFMIENDGWNALYLENHDQSRTVSRWGSDLPEFRVVSAKMFATFMALQAGTVFVYQGQELGMVNLPLSRDISEYRDLETLQAWDDMMKRYPDDKELHRITKEEIQKKSRDNARTPMQWSKEQYAGFSTAKPWQKENESYVDINAESQVGVHGSVFEYWASILRLRKNHKEIFIYGTFEMLDMKHDDVLAYIRAFGKEKVIVVANFRKESLTWTLPKGIRLQTDKILTSSYGGISVMDGELSLKPFEAFACYVE
ncbi:probable alpha-glucosidase (maltase) [Phialocephala subalpina]|uniref:Probable alpha-glucosidase (Maltase) n=1 Tax=Phialocephala subalpina TaxID=576137 RepID=A0A1L7XBK0_9HELO|nr:probable alpha-glucosidase (maltase) [Phialocephala subalpina]